MLSVVSCEELIQDLGSPDLKVSAQEILFETADAGSSDISITSTRDWKVTSDAEWVTADPSEGKASADPQSVSVSVLDNGEGFDREAVLTFTIGSITKTVTVSQPGGRGSSSALVVYGNDFDKEAAEKKYGSGSSWPYCDQFEGWKNETGTGISSVSYRFKSASPRASSGNNNIWLPKTGGYLSVQDIALDGATAFRLTFGTICGSTGTYKKDFDKNILKVYLSADKTKWTDLAYDLKTGENFDSAEAVFSVPAGTTSLSVTFEKIADEVDGYRIDDVELSVYEGTADVVDFASGAARDFNDGGSGSSSGGGTGGTPTPENAVFYETFAAGIGNFTLDEKTVPSQITAVWNHDSSYKCMKATAYAGSVNYASESWLVSPEIDLANVQAAYLTFEHAGQYFGTIADEATLWISKNGGAWTQLTIAAADYPAGWSFVTAGHWDLADYVGSRIKVAFRYSSTATKAGTWEIKNVAVMSGKYEAAKEPEMPEGTSVTVLTTSALAWEQVTDAVYGDGFAAASDGVRIAFYKNTSSTAVSKDNQLKTDHIRVYKDYALVLTLENGKPFKYVRFKTTGSDYGKPYTVVSNQGKVSQNGTELIWVGEHASPFVAVMSGSQVRMQELTVVY